MEAADFRRRLDALEALGAVERRLGHGGGRGRDVHLIRLRTETAVRNGVDTGTLPCPLRALVASDEGPEILAACGASAHVVRFGRFDQQAGTRLRGFFLEQQPWTVRVLDVARRTRAGVRRELAARREVSRYAPRLAPEVIAVGYDRRRLAWLSERLVAGQHPRRASELTELAPDVLAAIGQLHRAAGVSSTPASRVLHHQTLERWGDAVAALPSLGALDRSVRDLLAADEDVEVGLAHGDLIASNILVTGDERIVLVDWEFATRRPLADDLATYAMQASNHGRVLETIRRVHGDLIGHRHASYPLEQQLVLAHVRMLSWHAHRASRAAAAGRSSQLARSTEHRIAVLTDLLG